MNISLTVLQLPVLFLQVLFGVIQLNQSLCCRSYSFVCYLLLPSTLSTSTNRAQAHRLSTSACRHQRPCTHAFFHQAGRSASSRTGWQASAQTQSGWFLLDCACQAHNNSDYITCANTHCQKEQTTGTALTRRASSSATTRPVSQCCAANRAAAQQETVYLKPHVLHEPNMLPGLSTASCNPSGSTMLIVIMTAWCQQLCSVITTTNSSAVLRLTVLSTRLASRTLHIRAQALNMRGNRLAPEPYTDSSQVSTAAARLCQLLMNHRRQEPHSLKAPSHVHICIHTVCSRAAAGGKHMMHS
jgi:hypothetical protein